MSERVEGMLFKVLTQWVFGPTIAFLIGVSGTYYSQVKGIRETEISQGKDIFSAQQDLVELRRQTDLRFQTTVAFLETIVKQNTEAMTMIKIQQGQITR